MTHILHINDNDLILQTASGAIRSQGYAWLRGEQLILDVDQDNSPVRNCRLAPQEINSRYWQQCAESPISTNAAGMRHAADLVWAHLSALQKQHALSDVIFVVPAHYQASNLQLLLGIAQVCDITVTGLVNKTSLALLEANPAQGSATHVDLQLHQTVISSLIAHSDSIELIDVEVVQGVGIQAMQDALLKVIQARFINDDRFDPLHYAETEQQLFDQLGDLAAQLSNTGKASASIQFESRVHTTAIDSKVWSECVHSLLSPVLNSGLLKGEVSIACNGFAGLLDPTFGGQLVNRVAQLPSHASTLDALAQNGADPHTYLTQLARSTPLDSSPVDASHDAKPVDEPIAPKQHSTSVTHLLQAGTAVRLEQAEVVIEDHQLSLRQGNSNVATRLSSGQLSVLNDESRRELQLNDKLGSNYAEGVITAIKVID